jgi:hypothetical protein
MGKNLAEILKQKCKPYNVSVDVSSFEEWEPFLSLEKEKQEALSVKIEELFRGLDEVLETDLYTTVYVARKK